MTYLPSDLRTYWLFCTGFLIGVERSSSKMIRYLIIGNFILIQRLIFFYAKDINTHIQTYKKTGRKKEKNNKKIKQKKKKIKYNKIKKIKKNKNNNNKKKQKKTKEK